MYYFPRDHHRQCVVSCVSFFRDLDRIMYHVKCIIFSEIFIDNGSLHVYHFFNDLNRPCITPCVPVGFIINISLHVYHLPRGLHRQNITSCAPVPRSQIQRQYLISCVIFSVTSSSMYQFICIIYPMISATMYLFIFIIFPWASLSIFHFMCIIFHVVIIVNISLHVIIFPW